MGEYGSAARLNVIKGWKIQNMHLYIILKVKTEKAEND